MAQVLKKVPLSAKHYQAQGDQRLAGQRPTVKPAAGSVFNFTNSGRATMAPEAGSNTPQPMSSQSIPKSTRNISQMQGKGLHQYNEHPGLVKIAARKVSLNGL